MIDTITRWHELARTGDPEGFDDLLADDVIFHSPVVHTPQVGKAITKSYLAAAFSIFRDKSFRYVREIKGACDAVLEFHLEIEGIEINGIDLIRWNDEGRITEFKVMIRPLKAINLIHKLMADMLGAGTANQ